MAEKQKFVSEETGVAAAFGATLGLMFGSLYGTSMLNKAVGTAIGAAVGAGASYLVPPGPWTVGGMDDEDED